MKENQEELDKEMTDAQPEPEIDVEAAEDSGISEAEAEEFETAKLKAELEEMEDRYLRARAEIANMANRGKNEREQLQKYRSQDLAKAILPSLDNLERALAVEGLTDDVKKGLEMTRNSLVRALNEEGVEEVVVENFDHNLHMAVQTLPADDEHPVDSIAQVLQKGYKLHERLLRPAMVVVYN